MTQLSDIVNLAFKDAGVFGTGQTPSSDDQADALRRVNQMISQWNRRRWLVYHLVDNGFSCTGARSYTVGAGGNFNITRPDRIEAAYIRQLVPTNPTPIDWGLEEITSFEEYSKIAIKTLAASPSEYFFYDSGFPLGTIYPWPIPSNQYELHILTKAVLQQFAGTADALVLPPEYEEAIYLNLAVRLRMAYRLPADPVLIGLAKAALNTIRRSNFQIAPLRMPKGVTRGPAYNIYADRGS